ncbi:hypothetical protein MKX03_036600, partial [Papaver bracteatum]
WEMEARAAWVGLWALSNPEKPWEWRKTTLECHGIGEYQSSLKELVRVHN